MSAFICLAGETRVSLSPKAGAWRTPLTLGEGIHWLLQRPEVLERNHCVMTIGSRLRKTG